MAWQTSANLRPSAGTTKVWWDNREKNIREGKKALHDLMMGALFLRRSGPVYDALRDERTNDYAKGVNNTPADPAKQFTQMEYWKPVYRVTAPAANEGKKKETTGTQHYQGKKPMGNCFRCDRPNCRDCNQTKKANGDPVRTDEEVEALRSAKAKATREKFACYQKEKEDDGDGEGEKEPEKQKTEGTGMYIGGKVIPSYADIVASEDNEDDARHPGYAFNSMVISVDLQNTNHAFNQASFNQAGSVSTILTKYQILNDNQSTSDIIVYAGFVINIRKCCWTLVLRTQLGECRINQIADMPGVGTVWYYPDGAANILSGHRLVVNSGWSVKQDSDEYHQTGNPEDLSIRCVMKEGVRCEFKPTADGLHVMDGLRISFDKRETHIRKKHHR